eukprot:evm.model.scf_39.19 EVM.evm.TU.scf_39.19   scf_39:176077-179337(-)
MDRGYRMGNDGPPPRDDPRHPDFLGPPRGMMPGPPMGPGRGGWGHGVPWGDPHVGPGRGVKRPWGDEGRGQGWRVGHRGYPPGPPMAREWHQDMGPPRFEPQGKFPDPRKFPMGFDGGEGYRMRGEDAPPGGPRPGPRMAPQLPLARASPVRDWDAPRSSQGRDSWGDMGDLGDRPPPDGRHHEEGDWLPDQPPPPQPPPRKVGGWPPGWNFRTPAPCPEGEQYARSSEVTPVRVRQQLERVRVLPALTTKETHEKYLQCISKDPGDAPSRKRDDLQNLGFGFLKCNDNLGMRKATAETVKFHAEAFEELYAEYKAQESSPAFVKSRSGGFLLTDPYLRECLMLSATDTQEEDRRKQGVAGLEVGVGVEPDWPSSVHE